MRPEDYVDEQVRGAQKALDEALFTQKIVAFLPVDLPEPTHFSASCSRRIDARISFRVNERSQAMDILSKFDLLPIGHRKSGTTRIDFVDEGDDWQDNTYGAIRWDHNTGDTTPSSLSGYARIGAGRVAVHVDISADPAYLVDIGGPGGEKVLRFRDEPHANKITSWYNNGKTHSFTFLFEDELQPGATTYRQQLDTPGCWEDE